jgi:hypothetical protein
MAHRMAAAALRLLALIALVLMPFGMAGTPALAAPVANDHRTAMGHEVAGMEMSHCADRQDGQRDKAPTPKPMNCMAACAAIPAPGVPLLAEAMKPALPRAVFLATPFSGIDPEIATPPPKLA